MVFVLIILLSSKKEKKILLESDVYLNTVVPMIMTLL